MHSTLFYYYHTDHLGTPQFPTDSTQTVVWQAHYDPFGRATVVTQAVVNNLRFPGQYFDQETGLQYNYFRDYDPTLGRYIQSDPIGLEGGLNTYAYVGGNPLRYIDPRSLAGAATGVLTGLGLDASTPDPTDAAWPKWVIWGATLGGATAWDWMCNESADDTPNDSSNRPSNPFKGDPGSSSETTNPDGTPKQKRYYGDDGYPSKDIDYNHDHGQGKPHVHDWTRPSAGGPPTHKDRSPGRSPLPGED